MNLNTQQLETLVDTDDIKWLCDKMALLQARGMQIDGGKFWYEEEENVLLHTSDKHAEPTSQYIIASLNRMRSAHATLVQLTQSLADASVAFLRFVDTHDLYQKRIHRCLPTEVLSHICELTLDAAASHVAVPERMMHANDEPTDSDFQTDIACARALTAFQLVCRRFRGVAVNTPKLWARIGINSDMSMECMKLFTEQSRGMLTRIRILRIPRESRACICAVLHIMKRHSEKWATVSVNMKDCDMSRYDSYGGEHDCFAKLEGLTLPSVTRLDIQHMGNDPRRTLSTWIMPRLTHIVCDSGGNVRLMDSFPNVTVGCLRKLTLLCKGTDIYALYRLQRLKRPVVSQITEFVLHISHPYWPMRRVEELGESSATFTQVRSLSVSVLEESDSQSGGDMLFPFLRRCRMSSALSACNIVLLYQWTKSEGCFQWLSSLSGPSLTDVHVTLLNVPVEEKEMATHAIRACFVRDTAVGCDAEVPTREVEVCFKKWEKETVIENYDDSEWYDPDPDDLDSDASDDYY